jgi:diguanylate cyclase (GGDEF)-like protein
MADRVLVAVADPFIAKRLRATLEAEGCEMSAVIDGLEAVGRAVRERFDAVVLDTDLPGIDGFEVLRRIRRDPRTVLTVVIMLTGLGGPAEAAHAWKLGPDDFVGKPFDPTEVVDRVVARIARMREALSTSWTELPGNPAIEREVRALVHGGLDFALALADLDEFKAFNDRYGFLRGNQAIALLASLIRGIANEIEDGAFAGHVGGDDFVLITPSALAVPAARTLIERFDHAVPGLYDRNDRAMGFVSVQDRSRRIRRHRVMTLSIGIATTAARRFRHYGEVAEIAAEMKAVAKRRPGSSFEIDRRSGEDEPH